MHILAQSFISIFDLLPEDAKHDVASEILRRTMDMDLEPPTDEDQAAIAAESFRRLDLEEVSNDRTDSRRRLVG